MHAQLEYLFFRSCAYRDTINQSLCCDMSWLSTTSTINPLAVGQLINNHTRGSSCYNSWLIIMDIRMERVITQRCYCCYWGITVRVNATLHFSPPLQTPWQMWNMWRLLYLGIFRCHGEDSYPMSTTVQPVTTQGGGVTWYAYHGVAKLCILNTRY